MDSRTASSEGKGLRSCGPGDEFQIFLIVNIQKVLEKDLMKRKKFVRRDKSQENGTFINFINCFYPSSI